MNTQYTCNDCKLSYTLSEERIKNESVQHDNFICDLCKDDDELIDPTCNNCGYECYSESLNNSKQFCNNCWNAYQLGKEENNG
jgi:hypothetical protein